ncbi:MAG: ABC-2 family transporter protein [Brevefilum sp.]|nr:ABC-2 family transporter protein [Brevefilum sp.]
MNHRGGWALIQNTWQSWIQHRGFFFLLAFGWMLPLLVYLFIWSAAASDGAIAGLTQESLAGYYLILILTNQLTYATTNWTVGDNIRYGQISRWLLQPMSPIYHALSQEIAGKVVFMLFSVPITALLALIIRPQFNLSWGQALQFLPAIVLAWGLRFFWGYWLALLAFWVTRADSLLALQDSLIFLLGGHLAPFALLPPGMQTLARLLPFRYMSAFPVEVLTGQLGVQETLTGLAIQLGWTVLAIVLYRWVWTRGIRHYEAVGG